MPINFPVMSQRSVHLIEQLANRSYLIICINPIYLLDITKPRRILWHPPSAGFIRHAAITSLLVMLLMRSNSSFVAISQIDKTRPDIPWRSCAAF